MPTYSIDYEYNDGRIRSRNDVIIQSINMYTYKLQQDLRDDPGLIEIRVHVVFWHNSRLCRVVNRIGVYRVTNDGSRVCMRHSGRLEVTP